MTQSPESIQEQINQVKQEIQNRIHNEVIPSLEMVNKLSEEEGDNLVALVTPLVQRYGVVISQLVKPVMTAHVESLADGVALLESKGFTREEAVRLISRS